MSKRHVAGSSRSRKKRKGSSYASVDLDLSDEHPGDTEIISVWDVGTSKATGRISATRKTHRHVNKDAPKLAHEGPTLTVEDVCIPANPEPSKNPPTGPAPKHRKRKDVKENDSVSSIPLPSSN